MTTRIPTHPTPDRPGALNWALITVLGLIWGGAFVSVSIALEGFGPWTVAALRTTLGAVVLTAIGVAMGQGPWHLGGPRAWAFATTAGVVAVALPFALLSWGQQFVPSAFAGVAMGTVPLFILPLVAIFSPEEGIGPRRIAGMVLGFGGLMILVGPEAFAPRADGAPPSLTLAGQLASMGAAGCYAVGSILTRRSPRVPPIAFATVTLGVAALILLPIALWREGMPMAPGLRPALGLAYAALLPTAIAAVIRVRVITTAGSLFMSLTSYMVPVWSVILGISILGEALPTRLYAALALILAGIGLAQWSTLRRARH